jgi:diacylglycerol kinase (ATP)
MVGAVGRYRFVVNTRSGGGQGTALAAVLRRSCGVESVFVLGNGSLRDLLRHQQDTTTAWIACGGDGTVSAVAEAARAVGSTAPIGVIPLGTGNDLARSLGWFAQKWNDSTVSTLMEQFAASTVEPLDCWQVRGPGVSRMCLNYCSLGGDAAVALQFHQARQRHPRILRGALINKAMYALLGARQRAMFIRQNLRFSQGLVIPPWAHALVFANIASYAGGVELAASSRRDDGLIEAVALGHGLALGLVTARLRRPRLLQRVAAAWFSLVVPMAMQIDGEPFLAQPGVYDIQRTGTISVLVAPAAR